MVEALGPDSICPNERPSGSGQTAIVHASRRHRGEHGHEIADANIHQSQIRIQPDDDIVRADVLTVMAKVSEQRGLTVKRAR